MIQAISYRSPFNQKFQDKIIRKYGDADVYHRHGKEVCDKKAHRVLYFKSVLTKIARKAKVHHNELDSDL